MGLCMAHRTGVPYAYNSTSRQRERRRDLEAEPVTRSLPAGRGRPGDGMDDVEENMTDDNVYKTRAIRKSKAR